MEEDSDAQRLGRQQEREESGSQSSTSDPEVAVHHALSCAAHVLFDLLPDHVAHVQEDEPDDARGMYDILAHIPGAWCSGESAEAMQPWCGGPDIGVPPRGAARKRRRGATAGAAGVAAKWASSVLQRRAWSNTWLALLRMSLPADIMKKVWRARGWSVDGCPRCFVCGCQVSSCADRLRAKRSAKVRCGVCCAAQVLVRMHVDILPHLANPHLLADWLTRAVDAGGLPGMLALHGIFTLVTQHGLEYPRFYQRLYSLLTPAALMACGSIRSLMNLSCVHGCGCLALHMAGGVGTAGTGEEGRRRCKCCRHMRVGCLF